MIEKAIQSMCEKFSSDQSQKVIKNKKLRCQHIHGYGLVKGRPDANNVDMIMEQYLKHGKCCDK